MHTRHAPSSRSRTRRPRPVQRGFTLIETALATVIVGVGVVAIMMAQAAFHKQNSWSTHATIAMQLGNELREMTINLPRHDPVTGTLNWGPEPGELLADFDDVDDFDGAGSGLVFSAAAGDGPLNAQRAVIPNMTGWAQEIRVYNVNASNITGAAVADGSTNTMMVEVVVTYQGAGDTTPQEMTRVSWMAPR